MIQKLEANDVVLPHFVDYQYRQPMNLNFFLNKLNLTMESITQKSPYLAVVIGDFNARLSKWWTDNKITQEGLKIEKLLVQFFLQQVINKHTHVS